MHCIQVFATCLRENIATRFAGLCSTTNLALCAAALHPKHANLEFIPEENRRVLYDSIWDKIIADTTALQSGRK